MDRCQFDTLDGATLVNGFTNDVHDTAEGSSADGDLNWGTSVDDFLATNKTFCTVHGNSADAVLAEMGSDFKDETTTMEILDLEGVQDGWKVFTVKLDVDDGTNDCFDRANLTLGLSGI